MKKPYFKKKLTYKVLIIHKIVSNQNIYNDQEIEMTLSKKITTLSTIIFTGLSSYLLSDNSASAAPTRPFEESNTIENISPKILMLQLGKILPYLLLTLVHAF